MAGSPSFGVLSNVTRKTFDLYIKGRLAKQAIDCMFNRLASTSEAFDCIHPACFCLSAENVSPSRGTGDLGHGFVEGFGQRLE